MFPELNKAYAPQEIEPRWAALWVERRLFAAATAAPGAVDARPAWALVIPPPNVTGSLHMGHMLEHTLIDITVRWQRMRGKNVLWLPGTDHAGIATQMVVERDLAAKGQRRQEMGREAFVEAVWAWKRQSGDRIKEQMIRLGASCDWSRERFTLDEGLSRAVREVFVQLYEEGLIYHAEYIVNWCPRCQTAISDLEVVHEAVQGKLYQVRYPVAGAPGEFLTVATTRPETILADVAVAVNPADARYQALIGRQVEAPLTGRTVPVIADEIAQPEYGTGAVKITPNHDANDFAAGRRHGLTGISVLDATGVMNAQAGAYAGLDRFEARRRVVADLEAAGLLAGVAEHPMAVGHCQRCRTVIEPRVSPQWFVRIAPLAGAAVEAVASGAIRFTPENNAKIYFDWMANIHDWCISRQLWWGHRIPVWHCGECRQVMVAREAPGACTQCGSRSLRQDPDVLDTWFSSGLWPFSTLGWPEETADLATFYPTALLITGFDILFFWVARMIMLGVHFMRPRRDSLAEAAPFREVYIHALVRDADKQKMSKTKGNVIDPLAVTEKYGTDAVRFTLAAMAAPGTDIALAEERMQGYAAFANKIWNAARFIFLNLNRFPELRLAASPERVGARGAHSVDRWVFSRLNALAGELERGLGVYRYHEAADRLYHFVWHEFCDWYLELAKPRLQAGDAEAAANLAAAFEALLRLLHPFMPFLTEELWTAMFAGAAPHASIALAPYPQAEETAVDAPAEAAVARLQAVVNEVRRLRSEWKVAPRAGVRLRAAARRQPAPELDWASVQALARVEAVEAVATLAAGGLGFASTPDYDLQLDLRGVVDVAAERARLEKERATLAQGVANLERQLASESFRARAPEAVIADCERRRLELARQLRQTEASQRALEAAERA